MTMIVPILIRSNPPTHETVTRYYSSEGRQIVVSVTATVGVGTSAIFDKLPRTWHRERPPADEAWTFAWFGIWCFVLFVVGLALFFGAVLLDVAGWLPAVDWPGYDNTDKFWGWSFHYYIRFAIVSSGVGFVVATVAWLIKISRE